MSAIWLRVSTVALGAGTSAVVAVPPVTAVDQVMVLEVWLDNPALTGVIASTGFTTKYEDVVAGSGIRTILYKRLIGSDTGNYTVTWGGTSVTREVLCHQISGAFSTGDPWFGTSDLQVASGTVTVPATSVAATPSGSCGLWFVATDTTGTSTTPSTSGNAWSPRVNASTSQLTVFSKLHATTSTLTAGATSWSATCGAINVRLAALLEEPTGLPIDVGLGSLSATGAGVSLGHTLCLPNEP